ncbi:hypothetical protein DVA67_033025 [Solirubrobacter sp. CPCC 204708]|uniref:Uncharacterized protein n=1 Tax=Solirubrobacter deserti TaxID=2282478 RepID=A0ABT4RIS2_9ACTN|nr:hypothetical protein [Solirubrobacter deserti]MBE2320829.1 hypothetical protein [Solirubrobacter deserti]MDA0138464.1 hypothetical protein [Solirubrobacter deserti]
MAGRYALIAAPADDEDATALAGLLGDPRRGGYTVERAQDGEAVMRFLAARTPTDVVLVHTDRVPVDPEALAACRSTHVLVIAAGRRLAPEAGPGRAVLAGASTRAIVRVLRDGRADGNADGDITARELHNRLAHTMTLDFRDELETPFVVTHTQRHARARERELRRNRREHRQELSVRSLRVAAAAGGVALLGSLPLMWVFGGSGLEYAFAGDTAWPSRIAPLLCLLTALTGLGFAATRHGDTALAALVSASVGGIYGLMDRFAEPDLGLGVLIAFLALALLALSSLRAILRRLEYVGTAAFGAACLGYQVVGPRSVGVIVVAVFLLAAGLVGTRNV